jgi:hypothetical protein
MTAHAQTTTKVEEREFLTRVLKRLQDQTRVMRNTLDLHIQGKNANYADLESKRCALTNHRPPPPLPPLAVMTE